MLKLGHVRKVAITGGIACGKSTVCSIFKELGAKIIDADEIVHRQLSPDTQLGREVIALLGSDIIEDHKIIRSKIAAKVFHNPDLLKALEHIIHPFVRSEIEKQLQEVERENKTAVAVVEIPLLFETGFQDLFDWTVAVIAEPEVSLQRFLLRSGANMEDYQQRRMRQLPLEEKSRKAHFTVINNGNLELLKENVKVIFDTINNFQQPTTK